MDLSVARNTALTLRSKLARCGLINSRTERAVAQEWSTNLEVKTASQDTPVSALSGGNQQKVVLAKWLATDPKILTSTSRPAASTWERRPKYTA